MPSTSVQEVDRLIATLPSSLRAAGRAVRLVVRKTAPELTEMVKWGNPVWVGQANAICLMLYADHLNLGFFRGAELVVDHPFLEGTGNGMRHVRIRDVKTARSPAIARVIRAAAALDGSPPSPPAIPES
jgi:hypothetical protein